MSKPIRRIWKFPVPIRTSFTLELDPNHRIVLVDHQPVSHQDCLWIELDPFAPKRSYTFYIFGTGHDIEDDNLTHVASWQAGEFVWHLYRPILSHKS